MIALVNSHFNFKGFNNTYDIMKFEHVMKVKFDIWCKAKLYCLNLLYIKILLN